MDRRKFLQATAAAMAGRPKTVRSSPARPNILWLVSEDNNPWLGCYGDRTAATPHLDRLAQEGLLFTNAFANAPVCAPARSTIHTGMYATALGTHHMRSCNPLPAFVRFFTEILREAGYFCVNHYKTDYNTTGTPPAAWDENSVFASYRHRRPGQPFFSFLNFMTTHESSLHRSRKTIHDPAEVSLAPYHPDTPVIRRDYAQYYDQITRLDTRIGRVLARLAAEGLDQDTIVFYFSDNGGVLPRSKRFLYDSGMHVPLIVRFPEKFRRLAPAAPGSVIDRLVSFIDFAPTVLRLAGLPIPEWMHGRPFLGEHPPAPRIMFSVSATGWTKGMT